jgi:hypothetical protein
VRASASGVVLPALAVLALVGIVAIAARGSTDSGSTSSRTPGATFIDTVVSLGMVALVPAAAILIYGLTQREAIRREMVAARRFRRLSFVGFVLFMLIFTLAAYFRLRDWKQAQIVDEIGEQGYPGDGLPPRTPAGESEVHQPEFAWIPVLVVVGVVLIGLAAWWLSARRRTELAPEERELAAEVADALADGLDDLRAEPDPRRAVIAAYARLERALARSGLPRAAHETAEEYVARILDRLEVDRALVRRLTDLFVRAKFSQHPVDEAMREDAIAALQSVRDELRAAARARAEEVARAHAHRERTAAS